MKRKDQVLALLIAMVLLAACSSPSKITKTEPASTDKTEIAQTEEEKTASEATDKEETKTDEDGLTEIPEGQLLENVGEYSKVYEQRVDLLKIFRPEGEFYLNEDLMVEFKDIKIMKMSEIPASNKGSVQEIFGFRDEGTILQIAYNITNLTDTTIHGTEIIDVVTQDGTQYHLYTNGTVLDYGTTTVRPRGTIPVSVGLSVANPDISALDLYITYYFDDTGYTYTGSISLNLVEE